MPRQEGFAWQWKVPKARRTTDHDRRKIQLQEHIESSAVDHPLGSSKPTFKAGRMNHESCATSDCCRHPAASVLGTCAALLLYFTTPKSAICCRQGDATRFPGQCCTVPRSFASAQAPCWHSHLQPISRGVADTRCFPHPSCCGLVSGDAGRRHRHRQRLPPHRQNRGWRGSCFRQLLPQPKCRLH